MKKDLFDAWCRDATRLIRFTPDRKAVYNELMAHLQDRQNDLMDQGLPPDQAETQAVAAMGDAWELSDQLAQIHRPFWGYAHRITKIIALLLVVVLAFQTIVPYVKIGVALWNYSSDPALFAPTGDGWEAVIHVQPDITYRCDGYKLQIQDAFLWQNGEEWKLSIGIQSLSLPYNNFFAALDHFWAVDNLGNIYTSVMESRPSDLRRIRTRAHQDGFSRGYTASVLHVEGLSSPAVQWVELHYDRDGRNIVFRIDLAGGEKL